MAGFPFASQMVSDTTTESGHGMASRFFSPAAKCGLPISSSSSRELEEEIGSPHFAAGLKNRDAIPCPDSVVVSDTIWLAKGKPAMPYGLRGLLGAQTI